MGKAGKVGKVGKVGQVARDVQHCSTTFQQISPPSMEYGWSLSSHCLLCSKHSTMVS